MSKNLSMSKQTPTIAISDNRGLSIRTLAYNRSEASQAADELISCNRYNAAGQLIASRDARLEIDNFRYQYNLAGAALRTDGVDNGTMLQLTDIEGRPVMSLDAKGTRSWVTYEPTLGRPLEHHQQTEGGQKTVTDRFFYAENNGQHKAANLNGQCIRHYDTAGLQELIRLSITGTPLQQLRRLLTDTLGPVDWFGEEHWDSRLSDEYFVTHGTTDALGQPLTQTDAKGHTQQMAYNRAGQLSGSWLTLKGGAKQVMVKSLTYSAAGQKLREESGNGVVTQYRYEAQTQRLIGIKTTRPALKDRPTLLQDLRYDYDPVGNILAIHNDAEATRFYRNQKIVPETTYRYDALYQLIEATGRESDKNSAQSANLPDLVSLTDGNQYVNYTRRYSYDRGGNLLKIQHTGASNYTTHITVSDTSNHGIQQQDGLTAADIRSQFDAAGNQQQLQPGQPLQWDARNQLQQVITVKREAGNSPNNDYESYLYGSDGMRIVKHSIQQRQTSKVVYLPGLELRTQHNNDKLTEDFQVITVGAAGRAQVRVLRWEHGKPDDIANNQLRYSFDNQIGSSLLELDHNGDIISQEEYYPFGGTAVFASRNTVEAKYKTVRYSGKERDATGLYYYGLRYYMPWLGRWLSSDPAGTIDGLNLYRMVRNNPVSLMDEDGLKPQSFIDSHEESSTSIENYRKSINELDFKSDYQQGISKLADIFVEYFNFIQKEKILQYVDKDSLIQQFSNESSLSLSEAKDYIEKTESFGFTASNLKGKPIFAFSDKNAGGEHYARHESIHLLSAPGGLTGLQTVNNNLNEAATEVTTRLIESHLGLNDSATMSAYNRAYPGLAEFLIKLIDVGGDRAKGGLLSSYLQNTGLTDMITPLAELWIERTDNNLIKQGFNKAPSNTDPLLRLEKATNLLGKDIIRLSGELGGQPNLKDITDFSIVSPIKKIGLKLGFSV